ncbi:hypothetical protein ACI6Q2_23100 [Chitinophagaceae bacterium LWZ2-11]
MSIKKTEKKVKLQTTNPILHVRDIKITAMKKSILLILLTVAFFSVTKAQTPQNDRRAEMVQALKQRLKDEVKLSDVQADSVLAITLRYSTQIRPIRMDQSLSAEDKDNKVKPLENERNAKWKSNAGLNDDQLKKVKDLFDNMQKKMRSN